MMCGPDVGRLIAIADQLLQHHEKQHVTSPSPSTVRPPAGEELWARVMRLYEQGDIDEATLQKYRALAERGALRAVDVAVLQYEVRQRRRAAPLSEEEQALRQLRTRRARLEAVRRSTERTLEHLLAQIRSLDERIAAKEQAARDAVAHDEEQARRYVEEKLALSATREHLQRQAAALQADLDTLKDVLLQIEAQIAALEAVQQRAEVQRSTTV